MDETERAIAELRGEVATFDMRLRAHRHLLAELLAFMPDRSWLARLTAAADVHEAREKEPLSAAIYREELDAIAALAAHRAARPLGFRARLGRMFAGRRG